MALAGIAQGGYGSYEVSALDHSSTPTTFYGGIPDGIINFFSLRPLWFTNDDSLATLTTAADGLSVTVTLTEKAVEGDILTLSAQVYTGSTYVHKYDDIAILAPGVLSNIVIHGVGTGTLDFSNPNNSAWIATMPF